MEYTHFMYISNQPLVSQLKLKHNLLEHSKDTSFKPTLQSIIQITDVYKKKRKNISK